MSSSERGGRRAVTFVRRRALARVAGAVAGVAAVTALAGCGFRLRGDIAYPFASVYVNSPTATPLATELRRTLEGGGTKLAPTPAEGEVVLDLSAVADDKQVLSLSGGGRAREYQLTKRVSFALHDVKGKDWMPAAEIVVRRTFTFNESEVLAREHEEARLLKEMQTDAVRQIVRRLQAAKSPA